MDGDSAFDCPSHGYSCVSFFLFTSDGFFILNLFLSRDTQSSLFLLCMAIVVSLQRY